MQPNLRNHSSFAALQQPRFCRLWAASLASGIAMAAHETAARWVLSKLEAPALLISLASSLAALPFFLFTLPAGFLADLVDRPRLLRLINGWLATVAGTLAILGFSGKLTGGTVLLGAFGLGVGFAFNAPVWAALLTDLAPRERLASAATLGALQLNLSSLLGPLLGGYLLAAINPNLVFAVNAAGFLGVAVALPTCLHVPAAKPFNPRRFARSLTKVARYVCSSPPLRTVLARNGFFALFVAAIPTLLPVIALRDLQLELGRLGLLFTLMSTGSVAASLFLSGWAQRRFSSNRILLGGNSLLALIFLGAAWGGLAPSHWFLLPLAGAAWTLSASELWVVAQRVIRPWASGRVNAAVIMLSQGAMAAGSVVWGVLAHTYGTRPTLATVAVLFAAYLALTRKGTGPLAKGTQDHRLWNPTFTPERSVKCQGFAGQSREGAQATRINPERQLKCQFYRY
jgi:MFS family permease